MKKSPKTIAVGMLAVAALLGIGIVAATWADDLHQPAVVEAARTYELVSDDNGRYRASLLDGRRARGPGLSSQKVLAFDRDDMVQVDVLPELQSGMRVTVGQPLASVRSVAAERGLTSLTAERDALTAERDLLAAGERTSMVEEGRQRLRLAEAVRAQEAPTLRRLQELASSGAISRAELEQAELLDQVRQVEIQVARASMQVASSSARPEALASIDAQMAAIDAKILGLHDRIADTALSSPIDGVLEIGGHDAILRVYELDAAYLRFPIPERARSRVAVGDGAYFSTPSAPVDFNGTVVEISEVATVLHGRTVFLATARVENPQLHLRAGMTGETEVQLRPGRGMVLSLWDELVGKGTDG